MKIALVFLLIAFLTAQVFATTEEEYQSVFEQWVAEHRKVYDEHEVLYRFRVFKKNHDLIKQHSSEVHNFTVALNKFADLTNSEFLEKYTGLHRRLVGVTSSPERLFQSAVTATPPTSIDWRTKGRVTPVKDQGQCGGCWSFSTTGAVEGAWSLNHTLVSLSEQNLMDCSSSYGNQGCNGGLMDLAFKYIINNHGIDTEASYPYTAHTSYSCRYSTANKGATISSYQDIPQGSETALQSAVASAGPVSVAIDASQWSFQFYSGGVYYEPWCSSTSLDHGVLVVGYGTDPSNGDYWIVKNSWGTYWGDNGYINMARNQNNNCGIATSASFPIV